MSDEGPDTPEILRQPVGAGAAALDASLDELPLVVWLRGDEPHCADFVLEADEVMAQLGIRRSRLTQISGKELRVGRMRRGRYVSPVYRQSDVDSYLEWTRATASHLKSSSVLQEAADALRSHGETLAGRLSEIPAELAAELERHLRQTEVAGARHVYEGAASVKAAVAGVSALVFEETRRTQRAVSRLDLRFAEILQRLDGQAARLDVARSDLAELTAASRLAREDTAALAVRLDALASRLDSQQEAFTAQQELLRATAEAQHALMQSVAAGAAAQQAAFATLLMRIEASSPEPRQATRAPLRPSRAGARRLQRQAPAVSRR